MSRNLSFNQRKYLREQQREIEEAPGYKEGKRTDWEFRLSELKNFVSSKDITIPSQGIYRIKCHIGEVDYYPVKDRCFVRPKEGKKFWTARNEGWYFIRNNIML